MIDFATASMEAKRKRGKLKAVEDEDEPVLMNDDETLRAWEAPKKWIVIANHRLAGLYRPIIRRQVAEILGVWAAWDGFCRHRVGVDGPMAMRAHCPPLVEQIEAIRTEYPNINP